MLYANINGEKIEAQPKMFGICPLCDRTVFSKCGEINVWHWAHQKDDSCDSWYEPETEWHKNWKDVFEKDEREIIIIKDGVKHIADIQTKGNVVIELQNSPIQSSVIRDRENFYGARMIWVINGKKFKNNFVIKNSKLSEDEIYYRLNYPLSPDYGKTHLPQDDKFIFTWSWCRRSWSDVQRPVFIDFGCEYLFWITEGMGESYGQGKKITKEKFLKKYEGNLQLLQTLVTPK